MRYYGIRIDGAPTPFPALPGAREAGAQWCSVVNTSAGMLNDPGAQQVEFDLTEFRANDSTPNCTVTIQNPSLDQLSQMAYLINLPVSVFGGMWPGLPLATYHYQRQLTGWLMSGKILRAWGSWVGTDMSLSFAFTMTQNAAITPPLPAAPGNLSTTPDTGAQGPVAPGGPSLLRYARVGPRSLYRNAAVRADAPPTVQQQDITFGSGFSAIAGITSFLFGGGGTLSDPLNIVHNLMPNQSLADAIRQTMNTAFPGATVNIAISPDLKLPSQDAGIYQSLTQYAAYLQQLSQSILGTNPYRGITTSTHGSSIDFHDGTQGPISLGLPISLYDLIGQPTWVGVNEIQFKVVMRCDIHVGGMVSLPPGVFLASVEAAAGVMPGSFSLPQVLNIAGSVGQSAKFGTLNFGGISGIVGHVRHVGDYRNPDGNAWCTIVNMYVDDSVRSTLNSIAAAVSGLAGSVTSAVGALGSSLGGIFGGSTFAAPRRVRRYL